jgi:hypothetical protein
MYRRDILGISAVAALGIAVMPGLASAQPKTTKALLPGTWTLLLVDFVKQDGTHVPAYGPNPMGSLIFTPDGHYSLQMMRVNRPAFASKNPLAGTAEENKAAIAGIITHFGTYSVDEADKSFALHIEASSFPNWDGTRQKRLVTAITEEVLTFKTPNSLTPGGETGNFELVWKKAK